MSSIRTGELRAYFFGNMYLSSIQQGIQAGHVISDMFVKYLPEQRYAPFKLLHEWADDHKTVILLDGGFGSELHDLAKFFSDNTNSYPFAAFCEEEAALDGAMTSVGIILPEKIFLTSKFARDRTFTSTTLDLYGHLRTHARLNVPAGFHTGDDEEVWNYNKFEYQLVERLNRYRMAK